MSPGTGSLDHSRSHHGSAATRSTTYQYFTAYYGHIVYCARSPATALIADPTGGPDDKPPRLLGLECTIRVVVSSPRKASTSCSSLLAPPPPVALSGLNWLAA